MIWLGFFSGVAIGGAFVFVFTMLEQDLALRKRHTDTIITRIKSRPIRAEGALCDFETMRELAQ